MLKKMLIQFYFQLLTWFGGGGLCESQRKAHGIPNFTSYNF